MSNAASVHVEQGDHITISRCELTDSGNGLFAGSGATDLRIVRNHVHGNGIEDSIYEHNSYTEALGILFEGNHYGPLRPDAPGNNLKDRSAGTVIRYNLIEAGNRQLDLVDSGHNELIDDPSYRHTWVVGNILVEPDGAGNRQMVHYGGDSGNKDQYRKGTLHMLHNTVISERPGRSTVLRMSSAGESVQMVNNLIHAPGSLEVVTAEGDAELRNNYLPDGWTRSFEGHSGAWSVTDNVEGSDPKLTDTYGLASGSPCVGAAGAPPDGAPDVAWQYVDDRTLQPRQTTEDCGARE